MADVETEREMTRGEVAAYFHEFAEKLEAGPQSTDRTHDGDRTRDEDPIEDDGGTTETEETDRTDRARTDETDIGGSDGTSRRGETPPNEQNGRVTFTLGNESATVNPPETLQFEVAVDSTAGMLESGAHETVAFTLQWDADAADDDGELGLH